MTKKVKAKEKEVKKVTIEPIKIGEINLKVIGTTPLLMEKMSDRIANELTSIINQKLDLDAKSIKKLVILKRGLSGRIIKLEIDYIDISDRNKSIILNSEYDIRHTLHKQFLYSSAILIEQKTQRNSFPEEFKFIGAGWGHGVGLCQIGALGMALNGYSTENILQHYYKNTKIEKIY